MPSSASAPSGGLWRNREFRKLWLGGLVSAVGSQVTALAVPLTAVLVFGAGPAETGLLTAAGFAPVLLFGLPAGAWIDRLRRRPVRIAADLGSAVLVGAIPAAAVLGVLRLEHLYLLTFLAGTCAVMARLAVSALLPTLVGRGQLLEANSALLTSFSLAQILGPSLAGVLVQVVAPPLALLADAASFLVSAACFGALREPPAPPRPTASANLLREIGEGLRWLRGDVVLFRLALSIGLANLAWYAVQAVVVPFATRDLALSPALLGLALAAAGPATLLGALLAAPAARRFGLGPTMVAALSGEALSRILLLLAGGPPMVAALTLALSQAVFGFIAPLWDVNANSLRGAVTPERLLGRVSAASVVIGGGSAPVGALLGGWVGEIAGPRAALLGAALVTFAAVACLLASPVPRVREALPRTEPATVR